MKNYRLGNPGYMVLPPLKTMCWYSCKTKHYSI